MDFDFQTGRWHVHNRRLRERLAGCTEWDEFEAEVVARPLLGGTANQDEFHTEFGGGYVGMAFRFFDPNTRQWSIYVADSRRPGPLDTPVVGAFEGDTGTFLGPDTLAGRPVLVRFLWLAVSTPTPRWEQALSADEGLTWETNWEMDYMRIEEAA